jgi:glucose/arabinose dehydrogenase
LYTAAIAGLCGALLLSACSVSDSTTTATTVPNGEPTATTVASGPTAITQGITGNKVAGPFTNPTAVARRPMRNQIWVAERAGYVRGILQVTDWNNETGQTVRGRYRSYTYPMMDITRDVRNSENGGIRGIAFSTDGLTVYLSYINRSGDLVVAKWEVVDRYAKRPPAPAPEPTPQTNGSTSSTSSTTTSTTTTTLDPYSLTPEQRTDIPPPEVNPNTREIILTITNQSDTNISGSLVLGRDGYLYIGVGDDENNAALAQDPNSQLGKILRIDPSGATNDNKYSIPATNPYIKGGGNPSVLILGAKDPSSFSFDRSTGDMWIADSGASNNQEIDWLPTAKIPGANLGWPNYSGSDNVQGKLENTVSPLVTLTLGENCRAVSGVVYRGASMERLRGTYLFGNSCSGTIDGLLQRRGQILDRKTLTTIGGDIVGFADDDQGEVVVLTTDGLYRLVAS